MLGKYRLAVDRGADTFCLLEPYADEVFSCWEEVKFCNSTFYIVGRNTLSRSREDILSKSQRNVILSYTAEGSAMLIRQIELLNIMPALSNGTLGLMHGGNYNTKFKFLTTINDFPCVDIVTAPENLVARQSWQQVYEDINKPYSFLMLNGRLRSHRKYLIDHLRKRGLLESALWTNLDRDIEIFGTLPTPDWKEPIRLLPSKYEFTEAASKFNCIDSQMDWAKSKLFEDVSWGDRIINPRDLKHSININ